MKKKINFSHQLRSTLERAAAVHVWCSRKLKGSRAMFYTFDGFAKSKHTKIFLHFSTAECGGGERETEKSLLNSRVIAVAVRRVALET
jgi:hypothetical protein